MRREVDVLLLGDKLPDVHLSGAVVVGKPVELGPVARREQDGFGQGLPLFRALQDLSNLVLGEGDAFTHFKRCGAMIHADDDQIHGVLRRRRGIR